MGTVTCLTGTCYFSWPGRRNKEQLRYVSPSVVFTWKEGQRRRLTGPPGQERLGVRRGLSSLGKKERYSYPSAEVSSYTGCPQSFSRQRTSSPRQNCISISPRLGKPFPIHTDAFAVLLDSSLSRRIFCVCLWSHPSLTDDELIFNGFTLTTPSCCLNSNWRGAWEAGLVWRKRNAFGCSMVSSLLTAFSWRWPFHRVPELGRHGRGCPAHPFVRNHPSKMVISYVPFLFVWEASEFEYIWSCTALTTASL